MRLHIQRYRWVIVRDRKDILCELAQGYQFKTINAIGCTAIKTYPSEQKARLDFLKNYKWADEIITERIEFVEVIEMLGTQEFFKWLKGDKA